MIGKHTYRAQLLTILPKISSNRVHSRVLWCTCRAHFLVLKILPFIYYFISKMKTNVVW